MNRNAKGLSEETKLRILKNAFVDATISGGKLILRRFDGTGENAGSVAGGGLTPAETDAAMAPVLSDPESASAGVLATAIAGNPTIKPYPVTAYDDFATDQAQGVPDTPTGQAYSITSNGGEGANGAAVVGGYAVARAPIGGATKNSAYLTVDLGAGQVPKTFQGRFIFDTNEDSAAFISAPMTGGVGQVGVSWLHMEMHQSGWNLTYTTTDGTNITFNPIASGAWLSPLAIGTLYEFKWTYDAAASSLTMLLPGSTSLTLGGGGTGNAYGRFVTVTDPNIAAHIGHLVIIEPVSRTAGTTTRYKDWSAGVDGGTYPTALPSMRDVLSAIKPFAVPQPKRKILPADFVLTNQSALTSMPDLQHTLDLPNTFYEISGELWFDVNPAVDMKIAFVVSGAAAQRLKWTASTMDTTATSSTPVENLGLIRTAGQLIVGGIGGGIGSALRLRIAGTVLTNATASSFLVLQVAQNVADANNALTIRQDSWVRVQPMTDLV